MRNFETDKLKMYFTVETCMRNNTAEWETISYINDSITLLRANIEAIGHAAAIQTENISGYAKQKKDKRRDLEAIALFVAMQIRGYAMVSQNESLFKQMKYTKSSFERSRPKDLVFDAGTIHTTATENLADIINFGITQAVLDDMQAKITVFSNLLNAPIDERKIKMEATQTIKRLIKETDNLLKERLDNQMMVFKELNHSFYSHYMGVRRINSSPTIKLAMRCQIVDAATKEPLIGALVTIKDHHIRRKTQSSGHIRVRNLKEGNHKIAVSLDGYVSQSPVVTHVKGETTFVTVEMERGE